MVILLLILLLLLVIIALFLLVRFIKWTFNNRNRSIWVGSAVGVFICGTLIHTLFFEKMTLIQSKVYPTLYLIEKPIEDRDSLNEFIKKIVTQKIYSPSFVHQEKLKYDYASTSNVAIEHSIQFYSYYKTLGIIPFGEAGTAHFIENKEDPGGFSSELLQHYASYKLAEFSLRYCKNDTLSYAGYLRYYKEGVLIKIDTLINQCEHNN